MEEKYCNIKATENIDTWTLYWNISKSMFKMVFHDGDNEVLLALI